MSELKGDILLTFNELQQLKQEDISTCVDIHSAINICQKSCAPSTKIYNLWAQKLFKAYNLEEITCDDWERIIKYLGIVSQGLVKNLNDSEDPLYSELAQFLSDNLELMKRLQTINNLHFYPLCSILNFQLNIISEICKFVNNTSNIKTLCKLLKIVMDLTSLIYKMGIKDNKELDMFTKLIYCLAEVGIMISTPDIKIYVEIWRTVAKLGGKLLAHFKNTSITNRIDKTENCIKLAACMNWNEKAILGIFKELKKILQFYNENSSSNNDNLLQLTEFYLKLLVVIINYSKETNKTFPAINEFINIYTHFEMANTKNSKVDLILKKPLADILSLIYREAAFAKAILQHLEDDEKNFQSYNLVCDYLKLNMKSCFEDQLNIKPDAEVLLKIYAVLLKGPFFFTDDKKYKDLVRCFVVFTTLDTTKQMHSRLCEYVVNDSSWTRVYTSANILNNIYRRSLKRNTSNLNLMCFTAWAEIWNKLNKSTKTYHRERKQLAETMLQAISETMSYNDIQQFVINKKFDNIEIILLKCGQHTETCLQYLHINLDKNLKHMQEHSITVELYRELLNLLDICILRPQLVNNFVKENILNTFTGLLTLLPAEVLPKFEEFINKCLQFFCLESNQEQNDKLIKYFISHEQQCFKLPPSVFLAEFLLQKNSQLTTLLQKLKSINKQTSKISDLIDDSRPVNNQTINIKILNNLIVTNAPTTEPITKKPRLDQDNSSTIKYILNDLNKNTQSLLKCPLASFDADDLESLRAIKANIEKYLTK